MELFRDLQLRRLRVPLQQVITMWTITTTNLLVQQVLPRQILAIVLAVLATIAQELLLQKMAPRNGHQGQACTIVLGVLIQIMWCGSTLNALSSIIGKNILVCDICDEI